MNGETTRHHGPVAGTPVGPARGLVDDLGATVPIARPPERVVSLVPSLTEALALSCPQVLVGCTDWCLHPSDLDSRAGRDVVRVRGTKNPDLRRVVELAPDLVVANEEENRRVDVERLRAAGVAVWVTRIDTVVEALASMGRLLAQALGVEEPDWLTRARAEWSGPVEWSGPAEWAGPVEWSGPVREPALSAVVPVWRDPWMCASPRTYLADVLAHCGLRVVDMAPGRSRYPHVEIDALRASGVDRVVLPDEPYPFGPTDAAQFDGMDVRCLDGRRLVWYGPAMVGARQYLRQALGV